MIKSKKDPWFWFQIRYVLLRYLQFSENPLPANASVRRFFWGGGGTSRIAFWEDGVEREKGES